MCAVDTPPGKNISIHALREEGDHDVSFVGQCDFISIHALREEGDIKPYNSEKNEWISIHALREEGDEFAPSYR